VFCTLRLVSIVGAFALRESENKFGANRRNLGVAELLVCGYGSIPTLVGSWSGNYVYVRVSFAIQNLLNFTNDG
jgi:hypothetical protein